MSINLKLKLLLPTLLLCAFLGFPVAAEATLSFVRPPGFDKVVWAAGDKGEGAHGIGYGNAPQVSPDGQWVAYLTPAHGGDEELVVVPASRTGSASAELPVTLARDTRIAFVTWSPDSSTIAAVESETQGKQHLLLIDVASRQARLVASGYFEGLSFSPTSSELVYARARTERHPFRCDIFRISTAGGGPVRITAGHRSQNPLWGPNDEIVFVRLMGIKQRKYVPKNELFTMNPQGTGLRRLTHTKVPPLAQGLFPTDWSADGTRLLAEFEGQDLSYAVKVNPKTGGQKPVGKAGEQGFVGTDLSADGSLVLGYSGGFDPLAKHRILAVPYSGGKGKVLAQNAFEPSWSR
jgi:hypothetical protein